MRRGARESRAGGEVVKKRGARMRILGEIFKHLKYKLNKSENGKITVQESKNVDP